MKLINNEPVIFSGDVTMGGEMVEHRPFCLIQGGNLRPLAQCMFPKGHAERYHSSDGSRIEDFTSGGYYWSKEQS